MVGKAEHVRRSRQPLADDLVDDVDVVTGRHHVMERVGRIEDNPEPIQKNGRGQIPFSFLTVDDHEDFSADSCSIDEVRIVAAEDGVGVDPVIPGALTIVDHHEPFVTGLRGVGESRAVGTERDLVDPVIRTELAAVDVEKPLLTAHATVDQARAVRREDGSGTSDPVVARLRLTVHHEEFASLG